MARAPRYGLDDQDIDLTPVIAPDLLDLRVSIASIVHWADSHSVRLALMDAVDFPVNDVPMFLVVNQLSYRGAMRPSDLALALGTGRANLTKIAHRLDDAGLIVRVREPSDERSVLLALTPRGREIGQRIMEYNQQGLESLLADWSDEDVRTLKRLLARIARNAMWDLQAPRGHAEPGRRRRP
ncbi:MarR family winged helix-turn-helix transcriptional regulator [Nonomuraea sp. SYSU D8015]|uniref:MarR family winged helix-turn-helix transcriptional regulator n=1 Tax=Nonomuraea sp. SYSU D8015 TaxID=2593644 RepID=UPI00166025E6|nr:MarR family transcriptional regulator [Nonomuraea sp. SYSU D8015]